MSRSSRFYQKQVSLCAIDFLWSPGQACMSGHLLLLHIIHFGCIKSVVISDGLLRMNVDTCARNLFCEIVLFWLSIEARAAALFG